MFYSLSSVKNRLSARSDDAVLANAGALRDTTALRGRVSAAFYALGPAQKKCQGREAVIVVPQRDSVYSRTHMNQPPVSTKAGFLKC